MQILQKKLPVRIFIASCFFIFGPFLALLVGLLFFGCFDSEGMAVIAPIVIIDFGICTAFVVAGINILTAKIEYDGEKMVTRCFKKQRTFYFKDIVFFGRKKGGIRTVRSATDYWMIKTKEETVQIDIPVDIGTAEFWDFLEAVKNTNPNAVIKT